MGPVFPPGTSVPEYLDVPGPEKRNLTDVMAVLYDHEINCGCSSFWDGGFDVWLGDHDYNGVKAICTFWPKSEREVSHYPNFADAGDWLWAQAVKEYPFLEEGAS